MKVERRVTEVSHLDIAFRVRIFLRTLWAQSLMWAEFFEELFAAEGESEVRKLAADSRAQGGNLTGLMVGIAVAAIVGIGVAIPIVNDVIASTNVSGITATVLGFIPIMLGLLIFVAAASPIMNRT